MDFHKTECLGSISMLLSQPCAEVRNDHDGGGRENVSVEGWGEAYETIGPLQLLAAAITCTRSSLSV